MLELQTCPACKAQSSPSARECSRCGRSLRPSRSMLPAIALLILLIVGVGAYWFRERLVSSVTPGAADGFGALTAKADEPMRDDLKSLASAFRLPVETARTVAWSWTSAIRLKHPDHERGAIIDAIVFSVRSYGVRGSLQSYFEEYWALADRNLGPKAIRTVLRAQMYRGK